MSYLKYILIAVAVILLAYAWHESEQESAALRQDIVVLERGCP